MGKQKRSRQKFHNAAVKPKGDKKQEDEDVTMEVTLCTCHHNPCLNKLCTQMNTNLILKNILIYTKYTEKDFN